MTHDVIIIGSGAGGAAAAHQLVQAGRRVLLLEKGIDLPKDGSTLDPACVLGQGRFLSTEPWVDRQGRRIVPEEHFNVGGKTKWYGAALLRFAPHEFEADAAHQCLGWPIGYRDLAPYYDRAERLLGVHSFAPEPNFREIVAGLGHRDPHWRSEPIPLGLSANILAHEEEARHFDAFASVRGLKRDAETTLLSKIRNGPHCTLLTGKAVSELTPAADDRRRIGAVRCEDGSRYEAAVVVLAAGALHSPRLLQRYLEQHHPVRLVAPVGRNYKSHVLSAMLAFSYRRFTDVLCKTLLLLHEEFPHSSVQTLGGQLAADILRGQLPAFVPDWLSGPFASRVYGLFLQTEDGSHADNRVVAAGSGSPYPRIDYDVARLPGAQAEHRRLARLLQLQLLRSGYVGIAKPIPIQGTAHACGTLIAGNDPVTSVVDANGRVHGLANLYVSDGSVLPRSSRANPALTIYAWGLRVGDHLANAMQRAPAEARAITA
jgi:choline dehydrogenase-like flavoprotein